MCNYKQCVKACCAGPVDKQKTILNFLRSNSHQKTNSTRLLTRALENFTSKNIDFLTLAP